ncbi:fungal-specific transcription factor domain-containing protein [Coniochaeta sp. 2T2.1]|nr:fungal-specific transcription factor domain-containing protein [Coniochaeta sp. 2T2.1]
MTPTSKEQCDICRLPFGPTTRDQHNRCPFCGKSFLRVDAATRHTRTCRARGDQPLPPIAKRGRRTRACDACFRVKVSCDSKSPCGRCSARGLSCVYGRFCVDPSHRPGVPAVPVVPVVPAEDGSAGSSPAVSPPRESRSMVPFLLNCTDPSANSVNEILANEPEKDVETPTAWEVVPLTDSVLGAFTIDPRLLFAGFLNQNLEPPEYDNTLYDHYWSGAVPASLTLDDEFAARVQLLLSELLHFMDARPQLGSGNDRFLLQTFFASAGCQMFMSSFFRRRHYHSSLIHWPTLNPGKTALPLLLAMLLTGAAYSHWHEAKRDIGFSRRLHVLAEKYIFNKLKMCAATAVGSRSSQETLEILQAAYLVNYLNIGINDAAVRQRVMAKRHPMLVAFLRTLGFMADQQHELSTEADRFVYRESCIRLVTWTFLTDCLFTMFFNNPPAMTLSEVACRLPCSDELWDKENLSVSDIQGVNDGIPPDDFTLKNILSGLLAEDGRTNGTATAYQDLTVRHLHAAIFALQPVIVNCRAMPLPDTVAKALLRALDRWRSLWSSAIDRVPADQRPWLGLVRHAPEIAWLSRRILETGVTGQGADSIYLRRVTTYDLADFHQFIKRYGGTRAS